MASTTTQKLAIFLADIDDALDALKRVVADLDLHGPSVFHSAIVGLTAKRRSFQAALDARQAELVSK